MIELSVFYVCLIFSIAFAQTNINDFNRGPFSIKPSSS